MKSLSDAIWEPRLQVLWIVLSAAYAILGKAYPYRSVSSVLIVVAGVLLIALFGHVLFAPKARDAKSVLLVAFASSVFLATTSYTEFGDPLASAFAVAFSIMTGSLLCFEFDGRVSQQLRYRYFIANVLTLTAGALGYPLTLIEKKILEETVGLKGYYVAGAQGIAAIACFGVGLVVGSRVLPPNLPYNGRTSARILWVVLPVATLLPIGLFAGLYWERLLSFSGSTSNAVVFLLLQGIGLVALPVLLVYAPLRHKWLAMTRYRIVVSTVAAVASATIIAGITELGRPLASSHRWLIRAAFVELPTFGLVYGSIALGTLVACRTLRSAMARYRP